MLFTDPVFLFYFLPLTLLSLRIVSGPTFGLLPRLLIIGATLVFYGYEKPIWCGLFVCLIGGTYLLTLPILRLQSPSGKRLFLVAAVSFSLTGLAAFKYINWLASLCEPLRPVQAFLAASFGAEGKITLPPGISFFTFEALSFTIDAYRGRLRPGSKALDYFTFIAMFPRFIAGPIVRFADMESQFAKWMGPRWERGLTLFALGFVMKSLSADSFALFVPYAFGNHQPDFIQAWIGIAAYSFQLYYDFWSYSLMASGLGLCLGFAFPDNFQAPYRAVSITDFWRRWHISLSQWLRDYVYISLGGNRSGVARQCLNLFLTMLIGGLWHGASFTFVLWGMYHGLLLIIEKLVGENRLSGIPSSLRCSCTLLLVMAGWALFRSDDFSQAARVFSAAFGQEGLSHRFNPLLLEKNVPAAILAVLSLWGWSRVESAWSDGTPASGRHFSAAVRLGIFAGFLLSLLFSLSNQAIPFLYFQF